MWVIPRLRGFPALQTRVRTRGRAAQAVLTPDLAQPNVFILCMVNSLDGVSLLFIQGLPGGLTEFDESIFCTSCRW